MGIFRVLFWPQFWPYPTCATKINFLRTISTHTFWKCFRQLNRPPNVPQNIYKQYDGIKNCFSNFALKLDKNWLFYVWSKTFCLGFLVKMSRQKSVQNYLRSCFCDWCILKKFCEFASHFNANTPEISIVFLKISNLNFFGGKFWFCEHYRQKLEK